MNASSTTTDISASEAWDLIERIDAGKSDPAYDSLYVYRLAREDGRCAANDRLRLDECPYPPGSRRRAVWQLTWVEQQGFLRAQERIRGLPRVPG